MSNSPRYSNQPNFLTLTEPLEMEHLPLQVALLTMEVARLREALGLLAEALRASAMAAQMCSVTPGLDLLNGSDGEDGDA